MSNKAAIEKATGRPPQFERESSDRAKARSTRRRAADSNVGAAKGAGEKESLTRDFKPPGDVGSRAELKDKKATIDSSHVRKKVEAQPTKKRIPVSSKDRSYLQRKAKAKAESPYSSGERAKANSSNVQNDAFRKINYKSKAAETKGIDDKSSGSKNIKTLPRHPLAGQKRSNALSPSEAKLSHEAKREIESRHFQEGKNNEEPNNTECDDMDDAHNYEDDFEDYESDFEQYNSTSHISEVSENSIPSIELEPIQLISDEKKITTNSEGANNNNQKYTLDSGHYEMTEEKRRTLMLSNMKMAPLDLEPKQTVDQTSREEKQLENKSFLSSTDEGFEDEHSGDFARISQVSQITQNSQAEPDKKRRREKLSRGQRLTSMIKLDSIEWSLYEIEPMTYKQFIQAYGRLNTQQASTQTKEDNYGIGIQTDEIELRNKWTQFPVKCRSQLITNADARLFQREHLGVGDDSSKDTAPLTAVSYDLLRLNEFLRSAGDIVLTLLEERKLGGSIFRSETRDYPFSEGLVELSVDGLSFLRGREVRMLRYSETNSKILLSVHGALSEEAETSSEQEYATSRCVGCVWNIHKPSEPTKLFYSHAGITACCFHCSNNNVVFAGLEDGSICLWDLQEEETQHRKVMDKSGERCRIVRSPSYATTENLDVESHLSPVVSLRILSKAAAEEEAESAPRAWDKLSAPIQICSLDEEGNLIIWSVLRELSLDRIGGGVGGGPSANWRRIKLVKSREVTLLARARQSRGIGKEFVDMNVDGLDVNNFYLATNDANVLYANSISGRNNVPWYETSETDFSGSATCIEVCPFEQSYFIAGCRDGSLRLHCFNVQNAILKIREENRPTGIKCIQWSKSKPMSVYALDESSRIILWDLTKSDIYPIHTISTKSSGPVRCMKLSPYNARHTASHQYLALGIDNGNIEIHKLRKSFYLSRHEDILEEIEAFSQYVSLL